MDQSSSAALTEGTVDGTGAGTVGETVPSGPTAASSPPVPVSVLPEEAMGTGGTGAGSPPSPRCHRWRGPRRVARRTIPVTARAIPAHWTSSEPMWPSSPSHRCSSREPLDAPQHHAHPEDDPGRGQEGPGRPGSLPGRRHRGRGAQPPLDQQQDAEDGEVLHGLEDRHRQPLAGLVGVVHPEPLVGAVTTSGHHQLGTEQPAHAPAGHEHRCHEVGEAQSRELRTPPPRADDGHRDGEQEPPERREPALPDGEDLARIVGVVGEVGDHVEGTGAHDGPR